MTLWIVFTVMCLLATLFVAWPLYRRQERFSPLSALSVVAVVALSAAIYVKQGSPDVPSGAAPSMHAMEGIVENLAARLEKQPDDVEGWKMLGRSYMNLGDFAAAVQAFERAAGLENSQNGETLVSLAESILARDASRIEGRVATLFESALALEPNNPQALFYGGIAALNRGEKEVAAERWEILLGLNPPPEIQQVLQQRIAEWRGEAVPAETPVAAEMPPATVAAAPAPAAEPPVASDVIVSAAVSLSPAAQAALPPEATVFLIARDPAQPSPPIAVSRHSLSELPATIELGDRNSMMVGRSLSGFEQFELLARVSLSGQAVPQSGDWFGAELVRPADGRQVDLAIDEQVP